MNNGIKVGDLVKVVFVEGWRKAGASLPGLTEGDIGRVTGIVNNRTVRMLSIGGAGYVSHDIRHVDRIAEDAPRVRKGQRKRAGAYFLFNEGRPVGTCKVHGYKSKPVALLAALEYAQGCDDGREAVRVFLLEGHDDVYGEVWKHVCDIHA